MVMIKYEGAFLGRKKRITYLLTLRRSQVSRNKRLLGTLLLMRTRLLLFHTLDKILMAIGTIRDSDLYILLFLFERTRKI